VSHAVALVHSFGHDIASSQNEPPPPPPKSQQSWPLAVLQSESPEQAFGHVGEQTPAPDDPLLLDALPLPLDVPPPLLEAPPLEAPPLDEPLLEEPPPVLAPWLEHPPTQATATTVQTARIDQLFPSFMAHPLGPVTGPPFDEGPPAPIQCHQLHRRACHPFGRRHLRTAANTGGGCDGSPSGATAQR
jgi:hypothetical protein